MEKKKLLVNCANCDMRGMNKELLDNYEKITINAASVFTSPEVQMLTARYDVQINCANVLILEKDTDIVSHNGVYHIKAGDRVPAKKYCLTVNGKLVIEAGTEEILKQCIKITVNGKLVCPAGILSVLPKLTVNGKTESYPDGAVVLASVFCPDSVFVLRAKKQNYYASAKVVFADPSLDVSRLVSKGVHFTTPKALIQETLLEQASLLFDEETEIKVLKDGMFYLNGDITLEEAHLKKHGAKLFVDGNVRIEKEKALERIEELQVNGTVRIPEKLENAFLEKEDVIDYKKLVVERGVWITNKVALRVEPKLFGKGELHICDVANVTIVPEVTEEQISEQLKISDCAVVSCTPAQRSAVEMVSENVAMIQSEEDDENGGILGGLENFFKECSDTKVVNTSDYSF